jgi:hypothetical protein
MRIERIARVARASESVPDVTHVLRAKLKVSIYMELTAKAIAVYDLL